MQTKRIRIRDNDYQGKELSVYNIDVENDDKDLSDLRFIADTTIYDLADREKENLLIFPHFLNAKQKDIDTKDYLFEIKQGKIFTKNCMGFVGRNNIEVSIESRFDESNNNYFLHYLLQKVLSINLFDLKTSINKNSIWDFLLFLFPYYLKKALRQGMYKKYQTIKHNDSKVRGCIDTARHIKKNIPFCGRIAYNTKEYSYDNNLTQLIRHTIEHISNHKLAGKKILNTDIETKQAVSQILLATPSYNRNNRNGIIAKNLKKETQSFFTDYYPLQELCLRILKREKINFSMDNKDKVYGIIFDGAWLWEAYLNTFLKDIGFHHPENRGKKGGKNVFKEGGRKIYPDFHKEDFVLDAKYKYMKDEQDNSKIKREDLYQLISYMHVLKTNNGGFIFPEKDNNERFKDIGELDGYGGNIYLFSLIIHQEEKFIDFCSNMNKEEKELRKLLLYMLSNSN